MKIKHLLLSAGAFLGLSALSGAGQVKSVQPPSNIVISITITDPETEPAGGNADKWSDIGDLTYERRADFLAGLERLTAKLNAQFQELTALQAGANNPVGAETRGLAIQQFEFARFYLNNTKEALVRAGPETWKQQKAAVETAWIKSQDAYDKAKVAMAAPPPR